MNSTNGGMDVRSMTEYTFMRNNEVLPVFCSFVSRYAPSYRKTIVVLLKNVKWGYAIGMPARSMA